MALVEETRESIATAERRSARLRALLDVTIAWNRHRNTDELLHQIAETSTRLLDAERATIFLVDNTRGLLVGSFKQENEPGGYWFQCRPIFLCNAKQLSSYSSSDFSKPCSLSFL